MSVWLDWIGFVSISEYWGCELTASPRTSQTYKGVSYLLSSHLSARRRNISYDSSVFTAGTRAPPLEKGDPRCRGRSRDDGSHPTGDFKSDVNSDLMVETQKARSRIARALGEGLAGGRPKIEYLLRLRHGNGESM